MSEDAIAGQLKPGVLEGEERMIPMGDWPIHEEHCCPVHGCKYGDENCPVTNRLTTHYNKHCEDCENEKLNLNITKRRIPDPDSPLSKNKLVKFLKEARVNVEGANNNLYLYGQGRNIVADLTLIGIVTGEFEFVEETK